MFKFTVVTLSDRAFNKEYDDLSGPKIIELLSNTLELDNYHLIADNKKELEEIIKDSTTSSDLIITTGGTGLSKRDITVDVLEDIMEYEVRGISIAIHNLSLSKSSGAMFSRALGCVYNNTLIITLPGSLKAVNEIVSYLEPNIIHGLKHLNDIKVH